MTLNTIAADLLVTLIFLHMAMAMSRTRQCNGPLPGYGKGLCEMQTTFNLKNKVKAV